MSWRLTKEKKERLVVVSQNGWQEFSDHQNAQVRLVMRDLRSTESQEILQEHYSKLIKFAK